MNHVLFELQVAESHWHELQEEAAHERLARRAERAGAAAEHATLLGRLVRLIRIERRHTPPSDPRLN